MFVNHAFSNLATTKTNGLHSKNESLDLLESVDRIV